MYFKYRKNIRNNPGSETWDDKTSLNLFDYQLDASATYGNQDLENSIVFSDYGDSNVIAVTSIWYYPSTKAIVEFDMLFNDAFDWATDGDTTKWISRILQLMNLGIPLAWQTCTLIPARK